MEPLNNDDLVRLAKMIEHADNLSGFNLRGECVVVDGDDRVIGYLTFNAETEATFSQEPKR